MKLASTEFIFSTRQLNGTSSKTRLISSEKVYMNNGENSLKRSSHISAINFEKFKSLTAAKENGRLRLEGKDYIVQDGDIMYFRFNV